MWIVFGLTALMAVLLLISWYCYRLVFYNKNDRPDDPHKIPKGLQYQALADKMLELVLKLEAIPYEPVTITSRDGFSLWGRYYHFLDGAPVQIQFHGYRGNAIREYSGGVQMAQNMGYNVIVVDERAHGRSGGHTITFGIKERFDCADWVKYTAERFGQATPIVLSGVSMGAATVLMASELPLAGNVLAITADCPYSDPGAIIRKVCRDQGYPTWLVYPFICLGALLFGKFRIWEASPLKAVQNTKIPIHLIHGDADDFVPCEMSRQINEVCASRHRLVIFPGAGHGLSYLCDPGRYDEVFGEFLRSCGIGS